MKRGRYQSRPSSSRRLQAYCLRGKPPAPNSVIARSEATKQSRVTCATLDCFARNDAGERLCRRQEHRRHPRRTPGSIPPGSHSRQARHDLLARHIRRGIWVPGRRCDARSAARLARDDTVGEPLSHLKQLGDVRPRSRGASRPSAASLMSLRSKQRAQGRPGAGRNSWPPCVRKCTGQEPQVRPVHPAFPARWFERCPSCSPWGSALLPPSPARAVKQRPRA